MKKFGLLAVAVMLVGAMQAQILVGPKAGLNISTVNFSYASEFSDYEPEAKMAFGAQVGGMLQMELADNLFLQPALVFAMKGFKTEEKETEMSDGNGGTMTEKQYAT